MHLMDARGLLRDDGDDDVETAVLGLYRYLAATNSRVLNVALVARWAIAGCRTSRAPGGSTRTGGSRCLGRTASR